MNLIQYYEQAIAEDHLQDDPEQRRVLALMEGIRQDLKGGKAWSFLFRKKIRKGLYLYGPVGVGKTYLMDFFYQHLQEKQKARFHFHHFMQMIDNLLRTEQGRKDPLAYLASLLLEKIKILCLDEFFIQDLTQALIVKYLFQEWLSKDLILILTSNQAPDDLYRDGLQRQTFLPTIALLKQHCTVCALSSTQQKDYRLIRPPRVGNLDPQKRYFYPSDLHNQALLEKQFQALAEPFLEAGQITIQNRSIPFYRKSTKAIWFDFDMICAGPRSQLDYLELAQNFPAVFISRVPYFSQQNYSKALRFMYLVDILYDQGLALYLCAEKPLQDLFEGGAFRENFLRTLSRLEEMQWWKD